MMGCSNPHPHGQVWALSYIPTIPTTVLESQEDFANSKIGFPLQPDFVMVDPACYYPMLIQS
ncbi:hypothetical protein PSTG_18569 [Puccinia striiformis f. sp. tritici PST-78]|uniref:Galactose-1-phosphate uridylyltransferase n=1 Tax=Puccinia striiformis f. sp. tritici PST-78 TaxID=1165861 RepID=A0A0L0UM29_9BASI|nr:hypothetical protein PSTG_18569 [Puccinia striiformis f. sp. tritici PST-78]